MTIPWPADTVLAQLIRSLSGKCSDRKFRLFALACCDRIRHFITDPRSQAALEFGRLHAEHGTARRRGRAGVVKAAREACRDLGMQARPTQDPLALAGHMVTSNAACAALAALEGQSWLAAEWGAGYAANAVSWQVLLERRDPCLPRWDPGAKRVEERQQVPLLADVAGHIFHTFVADPGWLGHEQGTVLSLARTIYDEGAFDRLPILADALEDAGCTDAVVLAHCRGDGPHVRGCWVLDRLLSLE